MLLLRAASIISVLFAAGHMVGGLSDWSPIGPTPVLAVMGGTPFDVMGVRRTFLDFYVGFGHMLTVFLVLQSVLIWQIASIARTDAVLVRPLIVSLTVASLGAAVVAALFIFPVPAAFAAVLTVCLAAAWVVAK